MAKVKETITAYELLGLIKNNVAPKQVRFDGEVYTYLDDSYIDDVGNFLTKESITKYRDKDFLYQIIDILEENDEWEDIGKITSDGEEIKFGFLEEWLDSPLNDNEEKICSCIEMLGVNMNRVIKNQKYLKERLDKNEN